LLAAAVGATAATVASAMGRPAAVRAGTDGDVVLGAQNEASDVTTVRNLHIGVAIAGDINSGTAVRGDVAIGTGVLGVANNGVGVRGAGDGGDSRRGPGGGVHGSSGESFGVLGDSASGVGVMGHSGPRPFSNPQKTGIHGYATQDADARGVHGQTTVGQGVRGEATGGVGVYATATSGVGLHAAATTGVGLLAATSFGTALQVIGKARFSRSGKAIVSAGRSRVDVDLGEKGGLEGTVLCFANLQRYRSGVSVAAVRPNYPSAGRMRIYLNKAVTTSTAVAWVVLN
jgi:hypothetical protein